MKTDSELRQMAIEIVAGTTFTDRFHLSDIELLPRVFLPVMMMGGDGYREFREKHKPGMIYEYVSKALPFGRNGLPVFGTLRILSEDEFERLTPLVEKLTGDQWG